MITQNDLAQLSSAAGLAGFDINENDMQILNWNAGMNTHIPAKLPRGFCAVYIFKWNDIYLKVGKANSKSSARYQSHHYYPESSNSNLSKSLLNDTEFQTLLGNMSTSDWLRTNINRYNILIPRDFGSNFVNFAEAFFILKCNPMFEGS